MKHNDQAADMIGTIYGFLFDFPNMLCPDMSDEYRKSLTEALEEAVILIRTHALDPDHPLAID